MAKGEKSSYIASRKDNCDSLTNGLLAEMGNFFGDDSRRIEHARSVLEFAEKILDVEGGDPLTVKAAAILHDIGIQQAERKHGSSAARFQEIEGPPIARRIMEKLEIGEDTIEHVCRIVGSHHSGRDIDTLEFRILWDADWLVNIPEEYADAGAEQLRRLVERVFRTETGKQLAEKSAWMS